MPTKCGLAVKIGWPRLHHGGIDGAALGCVMVAAALARLWGWKWLRG